MKYIGSYNQESKKWTPAPLPTWFVIFLTIVTVISFVVLATLPGPVM